MNKPDPKTVQEVCRKFAEDLYKIAISNRSRLVKNGDLEAVKAFEILMSRTL